MGRNQIVIREAVYNLMEKLEEGGAGTVYRAKASEEQSRAKDNTFNAHSRPASEAH